MSTENAQYPLTAAVAQVESFEAVNEGIWVTAEALQNIEAAFENHASVVASHATEVQSLGGQITAVNEQLTAAQNKLTTANSTIAERDAEITRLNARIQELEGETPPASQTKREKDSTGGQKAAWENPMNKLADSLFGKPKDKTAE